MKYISIFLLCILGCTDSKEKQREYYKDGTLKSEYYLLIDYRKKTKSIHGEEKYYYPNGEINEINHWEKGVKHGLATKYYPNGKIQIEATFENGKQTGVAYYYDSLGNLRGKSNYKNSQLSGIFEEYFTNGNVSRKGFYETESKILTAYEYYESGEPKQCYIKEEDSTVYHKSYFEDGVPSYFSLPISITYDSLICFELKHSIYDIDSLSIKVHIGNVSKLGPLENDLIYEAEGNKLCIESKFNSQIIKGYVCEIHKKSSSYQGWMPFEYDLKKDKVIKVGFDELIF